MIIVLGSRFDPAARQMLDQIPGSSLCSAEDLTRPGWSWGFGGVRPGRWVVDGVVVDDEAVTGVFVRRSGIFADELLSTHPDDRDYLAAEASAFLAFVLARTRAVVVNPVRDGAMGEEAIRLEQWLPIANDVGLVPATLEISSTPNQIFTASDRIVEVVGEQVFSDFDSPLGPLLIALAARLDLPFATFVMDSDDRLRTLSSMSVPGPAALPAVIHLLAKGRQ